MDTQDMMIHCVKDKGRIYECDTIRAELAEVAKERDQFKSAVDSYMKAYDDCRRICFGLFFGPVFLFRLCRRAAKRGQE